jgi:hypothetical protein
VLASAAVSLVRSCQAVAADKIPSVMVIFYQMPFSRFEPITCIPDYYTEKNIDFARKNALNPWFRDKGIKEFTETCEEERSENVARWGRLR